MKKRAESFRRTQPPLKQNRGASSTRKDKAMILPVVAILKEICDKGRDYLWPKPKFCPCCKASRLWGHGFVLAYFDGQPDGVYLRRYRCPQCNSVLRCKPEGYFNRFQASIQDIRASICHRLKTYCCRGGISRTREGHWFKALKRKAKAYLGDAIGDDLLEAFDRLCRMGKVPVSRSI